MRVDARKVKPSLTKARNRILIIENDPEFRISIARLLNKNGFDVYAAENYRNAIPYLDSILIGLVLFDLGKSPVNNFDVLKKLINHKQSPCIIVLSAFEKNEVDPGILVSNIQEYLVKPVKKETLIELVRRISQKV